MRICFCLECEDVLRVTAALKSCGCGKSGAVFKRDGRTVKVFGPCRILALEGQAIKRAAKEADHYERRGQKPAPGPEMPIEQSLTAFVLSRTHPRIELMTLR